MGDYWANLDGLIFKFTDNFFFAFNKRNYIQSADVAFLMNLHGLVEKCKLEKAHENADLVKEKNFDFGMLGELFN